MKRNQTSFRGGFTLIELLVVVVVLFVLVAMLLPTGISHGRRPERINCVNNLRQIELAFKTWGVDNNKFPMELSVTNDGSRESILRGTVFTTFQLMSNELSAPKLVVCPADKQRRVADSYGNLRNENVSYFIGVDVTGNGTNVLAILIGDRNVATNHVLLKPGLVSLTTNDLVGWTDEVHLRQGNIGLTDGSVQQLSSRRLRSTLQNTGFATNRLAIP